jgi:hypothetical protein
MSSRLTSSCLIGPPAIGTTEAATMWVALLLWTISGSRGFGVGPVHRLVGRLCGRSPGPPAVLLL